MFDNIKDLNIDSNILDYLITKKQKNYIIICNKADILETNLEIYAYIGIKNENYDEVLDILKYIYYHITNETILHFYFWFNNIETENGPYHALSYWKSSYKHLQSYDFPINHWNEKAFIFVKKQEYDGWSDCN